MSELPWPCNPVANARVDDIILPQLRENCICCHGIDLHTCAARETKASLPLREGHGYEISDAGYRMQDLRRIRLWWRAAELAASTSTTRRGDAALEGW